MSHEVSRPGPIPPMSVLAQSWGEVAQLITEAAVKVTTQLCQDDLPAFLADVTDDEKVAIQVPAKLSDGRVIIFTATLELTEAPA